MRIPAVSCSGSPDTFPCLTVIQEHTLRLAFTTIGVHKLERNITSKDVRAVNVVQDCLA